MTKIIVLQVRSAWGNVQKFHDLPIEVKTKYREVRTCFMLLCLLSNQCYEKLFLYFYKLTASKDQNIEQSLVHHLGHKEEKIWMVSTWSTDVRKFYFMIVEDILLWRIYKNFHHAPGRCKYISEKAETQLVTATSQICTDFCISYILEPSNV